MIDHVARRRAHRTLVVISVGALLALLCVPSPARASASESDDLARIRHLESSVTHYVNTYGLDEDEALLRIARSPAYGDLAGWIESNYGDHAAFGGAWLDQELGGHLVLATTSEEAFDELRPAVVAEADRVADRYNSDLESVASLLGAEVSLPFDPRVVEHSYRSLMEAGRAVGDAHRKAGVPQDLSEYVVLPMDNTVAVTLYSDYSEDARADLREGLRDHPSVSFVDSEAKSTDRTAVACPDSDCDIQGGVYYEKDGTGVIPYGAFNKCSVGFTGTRNGEVGFFSAGHCVWTPPLGIWFSGQTAAVPHFVRNAAGNQVQVGVSRIASNHAHNGQQIDISFVALNSTGQQLLSPGNFWNPFSWTPVIEVPPLNRTNAVLGDVFCRSGFRREDDHLPHCGELYAKTPAGYVADTTACPGDSGGPFFRQSDHAAVGVAHSVPNTGGSTACPTADMSYVTFSFLSDSLAEIGGSIDGK